MKYGWVKKAAHMSLESDDGVLCVAPLEHVGRMAISCPNTEYRTVVPWKSCMPVYEERFSVSLPSRPIRTTCRRWSFIASICTCVSGNDSLSLVCSHTASSTPLYTAFSIARSSSRYRARTNTAFQSFFWIPRRVLFGMIWSWRLMHFLALCWTIKGKIPLPVWQPARHSKAFWVITSGFLYVQQIE